MCLLLLGSPGFLNPRKTEGVGGGKDEAVPQTQPLLIALPHTFLLSLYIYAEHVECSNHLLRVCTRPDGSVDVVILEGANRSVDGEKPLQLHTYVLG